MAVLCLVAASQFGLKIRYSNSKAIFNLNPIPVSKVKKEHKTG
jgi:hypothetical protein